MDFQNLFSVEGKVVCVTGGGGGIGRGIAGGFVAGGARVYIASRSDLSVVAKELAEEGPGECIALRADLSKDEDIIALAQTLKEREGKLDVLVNNAALGNKMHRFGEYPMDVWDEVNAVNLRAPFALTQECLPLLAAAGSAESHASVINIGSIDGIRVAQDNDWAYPLGKARWLACDGHRQAQQRADRGRTHRHGGVRARLARAPRSRIGPTLLPGPQERRHHSTGAADDDQGGQQHRRSPATRGWGAEVLSP